LAESFVTPSQLAQSLRAPSQPGVLTRKLVEPAERIAGAAGEAFSEGFGPEPLFQPKGVTTGDLGIPGAQVLDPLIAGPTRLGGELVRAGEATLRALPGAIQGGLAAFEQTLKEVGVGDTNARKLMRDASAGSEVLGIVTATVPVGAVTGRLKAPGAKRVAHHRALIQAEKAQRARDRAINIARRAARRGAPDEIQAELRAESVALAERRLSDIEITEAGTQLLRTPDEIIEALDDLVQPALPVAIQKKAIRVAQTILASRGGIDPTTLAPARVKDMIIDLLNSDDAFSVRLFADIEAAGMKKGEFLRAFNFTSSEAGRTLQASSRFLDPFRSRVLKGAPGAKEAADALKEMMETGMTPGPRLTGMDVGRTTWEQLSSIFRKAIISLPVTAARNFIDTSSRAVLTATNAAIDQTFRRVFTPNSPELEGIGDSFEIVGNIFGSIPRDSASKLTRGAVEASKTRRQIDRLIDAFPEIRGRAFASLEADLAVQKAATGGGLLSKVDAALDRFGLALNRTQEFIIRRQVLAARVDAELNKVGSSLEEMLDEGIIPAGFNRALTSAINETLEKTFALPPRGKAPLARFFKGYAEVVESSRVLTFFEPFPRFLFNATKLITEQTPSAGLRLMRPINRAKIAEGDFSPLARELTGTALFATALAIRQGNFPGITPGSRYDEVVTAQGNLASLAPFATFIPYLFMADLVLRVDEGRIQPSTDLAKEIRRGLLSSAPQVARASDAIQDAIKGVADISSKGSFAKSGEVLGEIGAGFGRPFQLLRDFRAEWDEAVATQRETRGQGGMAALQNLLDPTNITGAFEGGLPERESLLQSGTPKEPRIDLPFGMGTLGAGLVSQMSGLRAREPRSKIGDELVFHGFTSKELSPKTGNKRTDALVIRFQEPLLTELGALITGTDLYRGLPVKTKIEVLRNILNLTREPALELAQRGAPSFFAKLKIGKMPNAERAAIEEQLDIIFRSEGLKMRTSDFMRALEEKGKLELRRLGL
jgi:hypothetical protein